MTNEKSYSSLELKSKGVPEYKTHVIRDDIDRAGRHHRQYAGEEYVTIQSGEQIESHKWCELYKEALLREGKKELFDAVMMFIDDLAWLRTYREKEEYALSCIDSKAYESQQWKERGFVAPKG